MFDSEEETSVNKVFGESLQVVNNPDTKKQAMYKLIFVLR